MIYPENDKWRFAVDQKYLVMSSSGFVRREIFVMTMPNLDILGTVLFFEICNCVSQIIFMIDKADKKQLETSYPA